MASNKTTNLDGGVPVGPPQFHVTTGNLIAPAEGFANDAGAGAPPATGPYGAIAKGPQIPSAEKYPGGNAKAIGAFFGTKSPGGGSGR
jgi:hypothetical protein